MNIREDLRRYLIETAQVVQSRRYKWLCTIFVILSLVGAFHVFEPEYWQLRRVRGHIADISPQWDAFKRANPGFEAVELFPRYDGAYGVRFAAKGWVPWSVDLKQLAEFMSSTKPPFPVDVSRVENRYQSFGPVAGEKTFVMPDGREMEFEKKTFVMPDGREMELDLLVEPGRGSNFTTTRSIAEPVGSANGRQPIRSETNSTSSAAGSRR